MIVLEKLRHFVSHDLVDKAHDFETQEMFPQEIWQDFLSFDFFDLLLTGDEADYRTFLEGLRLLASESPSLSAIASVQGVYGILPISLFGTASQQEAYLEDLVTGRMMSAFAFSEEGCDLERQSPRTVARQTQEGWELSGTKYMVSNAELVDIVLVLATTIFLDGQEGVGIFIVPRSAEGVAVKPSLKKLGMRAMPLAPMTFERVLLSADSLLGDPEQGRQYFQTILMKKRLAISAQSLGIAEGVFHKGLADSKIKRGFGKRPIDVPINQERFVSIKTRLEACRAYYQSCLIHGLTDERQVAMLKLMTADLARDVAGDVLQITGAHSFIAGDDIERFVKDSQVVALYGGSSQRLRRRVAAKWLNE